MKKKHNIQLGILFAGLTATLTATAQTEEKPHYMSHEVMTRTMAENYEYERTLPQKGWWKMNDGEGEGILNHLDLAVAGGTGGVGFDLALPVTKWTQLRVGGEFRPFRTYMADFGLEVAEGMSQTQQTDYFNRVADLMETTIGLRPNSTVRMAGDLKLNNFKFLVDVIPFQEHRNFHFTVGFYYGNSTLIEASNTAESMRNLAVVNCFNAAYRKAIAYDDFVDFEALGIDNSGDAKFEAAYDKLLRWGMLQRTPDEHYDNMTGATMHHPYFAEYGMSVPIGTYKEDVIATEDIYWADDEHLFDMTYDAQGISRFSDGTYYTEDFDEVAYRHRKGEIRYRKGEVVHKAGDQMRVVPDDENMVTVKAKANSFKPYIGIGYTLPLKRDHRTQISVDAGIMLWGGKPSINFDTPLGINAAGETVYHTVDMVRELNNLPRGVQNYVNRISNYPVLPEITLRISQRLW